MVGTYLLHLGLATMVAFQPDVSVLFCSKLLDFSNLVLGSGMGERRGWGGEVGSSYPHTTPP